MHSADTFMQRTLHRFQGVASILYIHVFVKDFSLNVQVAYIFQADYLNDYIFHHILNWRFSCFYPYNVIADQNNSIQNHITCTEKLDGFLLQLKKE